MAGFDDPGAESPQTGGSIEPPRPRRFDADAAAHRAPASGSEFDSLLNDLGFEPNSSDTNRHTTNADPVTSQADRATTENAVHHPEESGKPDSGWYSTAGGGANPGATDRATTENAVHHSEESGKPQSGWYSEAEANGGAGSNGGSNSGAGGPGHPRGAGHASLGRPKRRRWPWIVGGTAAAIVIAAVVLAPTVIDWLSLSVDEEDREIVLDGDAASSVVVPAGWVLEQRPFAEELVMYTPDGAVALCLSAPEDANGTTAEVLAQELANEQGWGATTFSVEHAPSGAPVVHALRPGTTPGDTETAGEDASGSADSQAPNSQAADANPPDAEAADSRDPADTPCGDKPVVMLAAVAKDSGAPVAVRIGSDGDVSPYFGEIASILSGVTAP